jgi:SAM-dependent methyltransferase
MNCRNCGEKLSLTFVDFGSAPPSNAYLTLKTINEPEKWFPLRIKICKSCWLVQTEDYSGANELFTPDYAYFSSFSSTWLAHAKKYVEDVAKRFRLDSKSYVIEVAANDGYLLQYVKEKGIPCLGIEPTNSTATAARENGIDIIEQFFGVNLAKRLAREKKHADLMVANNVLAHVPDINDFVEGFSILLKPNGIATFEFAYLLNLVTQDQFDTMYHEHYSYLSLTSVKSVFEKHGLVIFDVEQLPTQGGSLRVFACKRKTKLHPESSRVKELLSVEENAGINTIKYYAGFQERVDKIKNDFIIFLINEKKNGKKIIGYGAAAKGNTLLNYAGVRKDLILFVVDKNPEKQGKYLPGSRIPIVDESHIRSFKPDYIIIFPWNIKEEIITQLSYVREWGCKFVIAVPGLRIL